MLEREVETYNALAGGIGIPRVRWFGEECDFYVLVEDLLGPSLEDLFNYCDRKFSLKTTLLIAEQLIFRMQYIHSKGFLHRDIKPENFLIGTGTQGSILYAVDFGLAKEFCDAERCKDLEGRPFGGTSRYASIGNHSGRGKYPAQCLSRWFTNDEKNSRSGTIWNPSDTCCAISPAARCLGRV